MEEHSAVKHYVVRPGSHLRLANIDPNDCGAYRRKAKARQDLEADCRQLVDLQEMLYAEARHSLLIVLQAMDAGGKDGTIQHVMSGVNPQGVTVTSFKVPTPEESSHDYLWRVHCAVPPRRMIGIFNRSHYEEVLIVRVHGLVPPAVWGARYEQINQFEKYLTENGVTILKFFLHISKDEQKKRFEKRLRKPSKQWKFAMGDLQERKRWGDYMDAYEDMLNRTSTDWAPWYVIPANHKWYRNLLVSRVIAETLRGFHMRYPEPEADLSGITIPD